MAKSDFVRWDDVDIDTLLGEYTDSDVGQVMAADSDSDRENKPPPPKRKKSDISYVCPVCQKELKTIGGFRGHGSKQHNNPHLKACDFRKSDSAQVSSKQQQVRPISDIIQLAKKTSLSKLCMRGFDGSRNGKLIAECARHMQSADRTTGLEEHFCELFSKDALTQSEREHLFMKFHQLRTDHVLRDRVLLSAQLPGTRREHILFYQCFLRELMSDTLQEYVNHVRQEVTHMGTHGYSLSATEQEVLYHIAGYVIRKVKSLDNGNPELLGTFTTDTPEESHTSWTSRLDRGGLQYPSVGFFKLIIATDQVITAASVKLTRKCLNKDTTVEHVMDSAAVKLCWDSICAAAGVEIAGTMRTLECVVTAFFTVKGFSIAHMAREKVALQQRANKSLRHVLKRH